MSGKISSENGESWGIFRELTARARIHYKPFYLHYTCIEALFEDAIGQLLRGYFCEIDKIPVDAPFPETNDCENNRAVRHIIE